MSTKSTDMMEDQEQEMRAILPMSEIPKFIEHANEQSVTLCSKKTPRRQLERKKSMNVNKASRPFFERICEFKMDNKVDRSNLDEYILPNARVLGQLQSNKLHGYCEVHYDDGSVFKGNFVEGNKTRGMMLYFDKTVFLGEFKGQYFHGEGKLFLPEGKIIEGRWSEGVMNNARITYQNGQIYYGAVQNYRKHGEGTLYLADGSRYVGQFKNGHINGHGRHFNGNQLMNEGVWLKGKLLNENKMEAK